VNYKLGFYIPEEDILHSRRRENLKSYTSEKNSLPSTLGPSTQKMVAKVAPKMFTNYAPPPYMPSHTKRQVIFTAMRHRCYILESHVMEDISHFCVVLYDGGKQLHDVKCVAL
jgi:hypothetical protein